MRIRKYVLYYVNHEYLTKTISKNSKKLCNIIETSGFATTHVVVSEDILSLINLPTPYQPPKYVKYSYWRE